MQVGIAQSPSEDFPALHRLLAGLLKTWPEHEKFLARSFKDRSPELLASSDRVARMILDLEGDLDIWESDLVGVIESISKAKAKLARLRLQLSELPPPAPEDDE